MNNFGFSFFFAIAFIIVSLANNANSAAIPSSEGGTKKVKVWPHDIQLDASNWKNSCKMTYVNHNGSKLELNAYLKKILMAVETFEWDFNSLHSTDLDLKLDASHIFSHQYQMMPKFNKTLPVMKFLRDIHKSVQIYVGIFDALTKRFSIIDEGKSTSEISTELNIFLKQSKLLLCEIETSLNVSEQRAHYFTRAEMQHKIVRSTEYLNKTSKLAELDALYSKKYFYEFLVDLGRYLKRREANPRENRINKSGGTKKSMRNKGTKRKINKNNRNLSKNLNNSSNISDSSSSGVAPPQKRSRKVAGSGEKNPKRLNNKTKLNNNSNSNNSSNNSSNLNKKNKSREGGKLVKKHRHSKSTPSPGAKIFF